MMGMRVCPSIVLLNILLLQLPFGLTSKGTITNDNVGTNLELTTINSFSTPFINENSTSSNYTVNNSKPQWPTNETYQEKTTVLSVPTDMDTTSSSSSLPTMMQEEGDILPTTKAPVPSITDSTASPLEQTSTHLPEDVTVPFGVAGDEDSIWESSWDDSPWNDEGLADDLRCKAFCIVNCTQNGVSLNFLTFKTIKRI
ncbi:uncharacterized protein LOC121418013 [Lytechinus variegatus]|uniref:uncharacterized protein LOC121418013 n=1 Tax=Lytechinus variegatus TaxID=7654 RepID=UPI001BB25DB5|nr:uncharacterized protein LOC121418013 [Lytechinus variegatus]